MLLSKPDLATESPLHPHRTESKPSMVILNQNNYNSPFFRRSTGSRSSLLTNTLSDHSAFMTQSHCLTKHHAPVFQNSQFIENF